MAELKPSRPDGRAAEVEVKRNVGQWASIAQLLLLARLRARNRRDLAVDSLERAAQMMLVTCKNWFSPARKKEAFPEEEQAKPQTPLPHASSTSIKGPDAHRDD
ncbi:hypothetical protein [Polaromonas sp.]|uniref:hypothetical protein n=1 Tax=Polaromonas sp. TaxID=1869339 RepID=UPI003CB11A07